MAPERLKDYHSFTLKDGRWCIYDISDKQYEWSLIGLFTMFVLTPVLAIVFMNTVLGAFFLFGFMFTLPTAAFIGYISAWFYYSYPDKKGR